MSLVPIGLSNPVVPKITGLLESAASKLNGSSGNRGINPYIDSALASLSDARQAVDLLKNTPVFPTANAANALKLTETGVTALDKVAAIDGIDVSIAYPLMDEARSTFEAAAAALNAHSL